MLSVMGCHDDRIDSLEQRLSVLETVMNAFENKLLIDSVQETENGYAITFSDGSKAIVPKGESLIESITVGTDDVVFVLADGTDLHFPLGKVCPTSIVLLNTEMSLRTGMQSRFEFRVNPSNAKVDFVVGGEIANLQLDRVNSRGAESYVTVPENYKIVSVEPSIDANGEELVGQYTVTVEDCGKSSVYVENAVLVLTTQDANGNKVQLSSPLMKISCGTGTDLTLVIDGCETVESANNVFHIKAPYGTDVTRLRPKFETAGSIVRVKGKSEQATIVDFSSPVTFEVIGGDKTVEYSAIVHYSDLPIIYINTPTAITSKDEWIADCTIEIWNADDENSIYEAVQMKGRGNTTWGQPKKPYAIKLNKKAEVLGMPAHKRWVLLANYLDVTCMRNAVAFEIARRMDGLDWTPCGRFVEVVLNGKMVGNYYLCEQIKVDANRVDIAKIKPNDIDDMNVSGGYIFELDTYYDELFKFRTQYRNLPVQFKDPDEDIAPEQMNYVQDYFNRIETILYGGNPNDADIFDYIDMDSFIDWLLVHELALNGEPGHPKSCYMYKDRGGKLVAGPVWDFDYGTFRPTGMGLFLTQTIWYSALFQNVDFVAQVKKRWALHKRELERIEQYIDATATMIQESAEANKLQWPVSGEPNNDGDLSFIEAVERMKQAYLQRLERIGKEIDSL